MGNDVNNNRLFLSILMTVTLCTFLLFVIAVTCFFTNVIVVEGCPKVEITVIIMGIILIIDGA
jgi:hypothetical protein